MCETLDVGIGEHIGISPLTKKKNKLSRGTAPQLIIYYFAIIQHSNKIFVRILFILIVAMLFLLNGLFLLFGHV